MEPTQIRREAKTRPTQQFKDITYKISLMFQWVFEILIWAANAILTFVAVVFRNVARILGVFMIYIPNLVEPYIPLKGRSRLEKMLVYAGLKIKAEELTTIAIIYSVVVSIVAFIVAGIIHLSPYLMISAAVLSFVITWILMFMLLQLLIYRRTESVENALPDVLDMVAQNMVTGMTTYNSLWVAARPEFGPLAVEMQNAAKVTLAGSPLEKALLNVSQRIQSEKLERSIKLIVQGMRSGGELPTVLQGVSKDMRAERNLKKQMRAETSAYALFILFTIVVGAPLLFSISLQFMTIFSTLFEKTGVADISDEFDAGGMKISAIAITPGFFMRYIVATIIVISFFGGLLLGLIRSGNMISGIQLVPVTLVASLSVFFTLNFVLSNAFESFLGF
ncbi:MAG: type II secretion system F family protein [Candidatus Altiarchaeota archaeon]